MCWCLKTLLKQLLQTFNLCSILKHFFSIIVACCKTNKEYWVSDQTCLTSRLYHSSSNPRPTASPKPKFLVSKEYASIATLPKQSFVHQSRVEKFESQDSNFPPSPSANPPPAKSSNEALAQDSLARKDDDWRREVQNVPSLLLRKASFQSSTGWVMIFFVFDLNWIHSELRLL